MDLTRAIADASLQRCSKGTMPRVLEAKPHIVNKFVSLSFPIFDEFLAAVPVIEKP